MKVTVNSSVGTGTESELDVEQTDKIGDLIHKVATIQGTSPESISLYKDDRVLPPDKTLKNLGVRDGDTLHSIPRDPTGGAFSPILSSLNDGIFQNRIRQERARIDKAGIPLRSVTPRLWSGRLPGRGRWKDQNFSIEIQLPHTYPVGPPRAFFRDQPRPPHPNIAPDGTVCLNIIQNGWSPTYNLVTVYEGLGWLLANPNYHHSMHPTMLRPETFREWIRYLRSA